MQRNGEEKRENRAKNREEECGLRGTLESEDSEADQDMGDEVRRWLGLA